MCTNAVCTLLLKSIRNSLLDSVRVYLAQELQELQEKRNFLQELLLAAVLC